MFPKHGLIVNKYRRVKQKFLFSLSNVRDYSSLNFSLVWATLLPGPKMDQAR